MSDTLSKRDWFAIVPESICHHANSRELHLYVALTLHADRRTNTAWPSRDTLCQEMGGDWSRSTYKRALCGLIKMGAVTVEVRIQKGRQTSNHFTLESHVNRGSGSTDGPTSGSTDGPGSGSTGGPGGTRSLLNKTPQTPTHSEKPKPPPPTDLAASGDLDTNTEKQPNPVDREKPQPREATPHPKTDLASERPRDLIKRAERERGAPLSTNQRRALADGTMTWDGQQLVRTEREPAEPPLTKQQQTRAHQLRVLAELERRAQQERTDAGRP